MPKPIYDAKKDYYRISFCWRGKQYRRGYYKDKEEAYALQLLVNRAVQQAKKERLNSEKLYNRGYYNICDYIFAMAKPPKKEEKKEESIWVSCTENPYKGIKYWEGVDEDNKSFEEDIESALDVSEFDKEIVKKRAREKRYYKKAKECLHGNILLLFKCHKCGRPCQMITLKEVACTSKRCDAMYNFKQVGSFVYLVLSEVHRMVKIGYTTRPVKNLNELQTGCPSALLLLYLFWIENGREVERVLHNKFSRLHVRGEWYHEHDSISDYFEYAEENAPSPLELC